MNWHDRQLIDCISPVTWVIYLILGRCPSTQYACTLTEYRLDCSMIICSNTWCIATERCGCVCVCGDGDMQLQEQPRYCRKKKTRSTISCVAWLALLRWIQRITFNVFSVILLLLVITAIEWWPYGCRTLHFSFLVHISFLRNDSFRHQRYIHITFKSVIGCEFHNYRANDRDRESNCRNIDGKGIVVSRKRWRRNSLKMITKSHIAIRRLASLVSSRRCWWHWYPLLLPYTGTRTCVHYEWFGPWSPTKCDADSCCRSSLGNWCQHWPPTRPEIHSVSSKHGV